jgi:ABC-type molybdenum transport system, ATPase component/photorepair protein PhrA
MRPSSLSDGREPIPLLEFANVSVIRSGKTVLDRISVTIQEGEHLAILGPNGSGKSSFIKTITREYYPARMNNGTVFRVWGKDVWDVFDLRPLLGVVSNDLQYAFMRELSGREVILSGFFSSIGLFHHAVTPAMEQKTDRTMAFLGIEHLRDRSISRMSSGEARRFLIGRALVHGPKALILDEPTNSLDLHSLHTFRQMLRRIAQSGTGIILVTHHLHDVIPEIERVILMKEGRFWKDGPKTKVLSGDHMSQLFELPVHVNEENGWYYASGY